MTTRRARRGFVLLAAIWLLVALSALSIELSTIARERRVAVANTLESVRATAAAESGVQQVCARLGRQLVEGGDRDWNDPTTVLDPWHSIETPTRDSVVLDDGAAYTLAVSDLGSKVNINTVDEGELRQFLLASGIDAMVADTLSQAMMDWRDPDDFRRLRGAERSDYERAHTRELPRNAPFESTDELRFVRGMTPVIRAIVGPNITVFGSGQVNVNKASEAVLLSVRGIGPVAARAIVGMQRSHRRIDGLRQLLDILPANSRAALEQDAIGIGRLTFDTHEIEVRSTGWIAGSPIRVHETVIVTRAGIAPVITWRRFE
jgi:general secretion pathway protein K